METVKKTKKKKWLRFRHRVVTWLLSGPLGAYTRWKYGLQVEPFRQQGKRPYLILLNHQTAFDQFFVGLAFRGPVYYVASEDLFSNGWVSSLIRYLVAPIPIKKQTTDANAVMTCIRVAREGGTIAIAPEGNRTYSGKTEYMSPAVAPLARKLKLPIALFRIQGGYGVQPRWSDGVRKGCVRAYVSRVIEPEEYDKLTNSQLFALIRDELYVNEAVADQRFVSDKKAEYLERAMYVCPFCGLSEFESSGDEIACKQCGAVIRYNEDKTLTGKDKAFPFRFVNDWYEYQASYINGLDVLRHTEKPLYRETIRLIEVAPYKKKYVLQKSTTVELYGDRIKLGGLELPFKELEAVTVLGRNKLNIYCRWNLFQLQGGKRFNALKYVHIFHRHRNIIRGEEHGEFLGI